MKALKGDAMDDVLEKKLEEIKKMFEVSADVIDLTAETLRDKFESDDLDGIFPDVYFTLSEIAVSGDQKSMPGLALLDLLEKLKRIKVKGFDVLAWKEFPYIMKGIDIPEDRVFFTGCASFSIGFKPKDRPAEPRNEEAEG